MERLPNEANHEKFQEEALEHHNKQNISSEISEPMTPEGDVLPNIDNENIPVRNSVFGPNIFGDFDA
jgi:hypothetical protein